MAVEYTPYELHRLNVGTLDTNSNMHVEGFGINENNELLLYYSDETIAFIGYLPD